jgi:phosphatidate cytidylyltransferase
MAEAEHLAQATNTSAPSGRNLLLRVLSALVLAPLAIGVTYLGGWTFVGFWTIAALAIWWEWVRLVDPRGSQGAIALGACALVLEALLFGSDRFDRGAIIVLLALFGLAVTAGRNAKWIAGGILYASALLFSVIVLRADAQYGFAAILFLFAVVWSTDIGGYFGGRAIGGPKLAAAISPKKTWSGAISGALVAVVAALAMTQVMFGGFGLALIAVIVCLSAVSQAGDLFESGFKRHFGAKDSSRLIPGHGGVMDRLDGFIFASFAAACIGALRGGLDAAGHALLIW